MKKIIFLAASIFALFLFLTPVFAQTVESNNKVVVLPQGKVVNENYFAAGESVTVSGTVNGDAYVAGGNIVVDGTINGDLLVAGGNVYVRGTVTQDVRAAGGQINIAGTVGGNITAAGGTIDITNQARIAGSLVAAGGNINQTAPIGKSATIGAGNVFLDNAIGGNVLAGAGNFSLGSNAQIAGNLDYYADRQAEVAPQAKVAGKTTFHANPVKQQQASERAGKAAAGFWLFTKAVSVLSSLVLGLILLAMVPLFSLGAAANLDKKFWPSIGIDLAIAIITPIVLVFILISVIGLPLAFFGFVLYMLVIYISKIFVSLWIGMKILGYWQKKPGIYWSFIIGLLVWAVATSIPVIGWLLGLLSLWAGLGALAIQKRQTYLSLRTKKLV